MCAPCRRPAVHSVPTLRTASAGRGRYTLKLELNVSKEPSTKNADFGDGSTVHLLEQVPTEQKLVVRNPAAVLVSASPQILRAADSRRDKPIAEAPTEPAEVDNPEPSSPSADQPLRLELFKGTELIDQGRPDEPTIERVLSPGEYVVRVGGPPTRAKGGARMEHPVALNVLSVRRPDIDATKPRNKPTLEWRIPARLPALYEFDVPVRQTVAVEIPAVFDWAPFNPDPSVRIRVRTGTATGEGPGRDRAKRIRLGSRGQSDSPGRPRPDHSACARPRPVSLHRFGTREHGGSDPPGVADVGAESDGLASRGDARGSSEHGRQAIVNRLPAAVPTVAVAEIPVEAHRPPLRARRLL